MKRTVLPGLGVILAALAFAQPSKAPAYTISGTVSGLCWPSACRVHLYTQNTGVKNVPTDSSYNGKFQMTGVAPGTYTAQPVRDGCMFTPPSIYLMVANSDLPGVNFRAFCDTPTSEDFRPHWSGFGGNFAPPQASLSQSTITVGESAVVTFTGGQLQAAQDNSIGIYKNNFAQAVELRRLDRARFSLKGLAPCDCAFVFSDGKKDVTVKLRVVKQ